MINWLEPLKPGSVGKDVKRVKCVNIYAPWDQQHKKNNTKTAIFKAPEDHCCSLQVVTRAAWWSSSVNADDYLWRSNLSVTSVLPFEDPSSQGTSQSAPTLKEHRSEQEEIGDHCSAVQEPLQWGCLKTLRQTCSCSWLRMFMLRLFKVFSVCTLTSGSGSERKLAMIWRPLNSRRRSWKEEKVWLRTLLATGTRGMVFLPRSTQ